MQEAFEKNIEEQLKSFQLQPNDTVWQEVEAALHAKKRRTLPIWWMTFIVILLLGSYLVFNYSNTSKSVKNSIIATNAHTTNSFNKATETINKKEIITTEKKLVATKNQSNIILDTEHELIEEKLIQNNKPNSFNNKKSIPLIERNTNYIVAETNNFKPKEEQYNPIQAVTTINEQRQYFTKANVLPIQSLLPTAFGEKQMKADNTIKSLAFQNTILKDSSNKNKIPKRKWFITSSVGLLTTQQNSFLDNIATQDALANFGTSGSIVSGVTVTPNKIKYPNGIALMLGGGFQQQLSKKWSYNAALQYKLLSTKVSTNDSSLRFQSNNYTAHWIEIPVSFSYQLNKSAHPFYLTAGLSGAYAFASNWSYADLSTNVFYYDNTKNRKLFINAQVGAVYTIQKNWLMQVSAEKSLTSVHRKVATKFYYTQFNVQLFKFIRPKSKK